MLRIWTPDSHGFPMELGLHIPYMALKISALEEVVSKCLLFRQTNMREGNWKKEMRPDSVRRHSAPCRTRPMGREDPRQTDGLRRERRETGERGPQRRKGREKEFKGCTAVPSNTNTKQRYK